MDHTPSANPERTNLRTSVNDAALGFRRVEFVRVVVGEGRPYGEVSGVAHRYPRTVRVSVATAHRLAEAGVPSWIEDRRCDDGPGGR